MTVKETIKEDLLNAVGNPAGLREVFMRHDHSKGPLYSALGEATAELRRPFDTARREGRRR